MPILLSGPIFEEGPTRKNYIIESTAFCQFSAILFKTAHTLIKTIFVTSSIQNLGLKYIQKTFFVLYPRNFH